MSLDGDVLSFHVSLHPHSKPPSNPLASSVIAEDFRRWIAERNTIYSGAFLRCGLWVVVGCCFCGLWVVVVVGCGCCGFLWWGFVVGFCCGLWLLWVVVVAVLE